MTKEEHCMDKKQIRSRVSLFVGTTMSGYKFKPVLIGKAKHPRALKNMDMSKLPVHYYAQKMLGWTNIFISTGLLIVLFQK